MKYFTGKWVFYSIDEGFNCIFKMKILQHGLRCQYAFSQKNDRLRLKWREKEEEKSREKARKKGREKEREN